MSCFYLLQVLTPDRRETPYTIIVYIQGSGWMKQNVYSNLPAFARFAAKGYVIAMVEGIASFPALLEDIKQAIRFMRKKRKKSGATLTIFSCGTTPQAATAYPSARLRK